jgi:hypothetical protein
MIITNSSLQMASTHTAYTKVDVKEELRVWVDDPSSSQNANNDGNDIVSLSSASGPATQNDSNTSEITLSPRMLLMLQLVEKLTGRSIKILNFSAGDNTSTQGAKADNTDMQTLAANDNSRTKNRLGWGSVYTKNETQTEHEEATIQASGVITTADGRSIDLSMDIVMKRDFTMQASLTIRQGDPEKVVDPLVINLNGSPVTLTDGRYAFDLNADGTLEEIPFVSSGSGFLALDRNADGVIQNGKELFGPTTGNGFNELAALDEDSNGWIDEKDSSFNKLSIWIKDNDGQDHLYSLRDAGVGALSLTAINTDFSFKNKENQLLGVLKQAGLYVKENGGAGSMQLINLAV